MCNELFGISTDEFFRLLSGEVVETNTSAKGEVVPVSEAYQLQKKISELQEQLIKYQAKDIENKSRQIENKNELSPDKDITTTPRQP